MNSGFPRLDFTPGWAQTNQNLVELAGLFADDALEWTPRRGEWRTREIFRHLILARYHGPILTPEDQARLPEVHRNCGTRAGIQQELELSWQMLARFLSDGAKLDAVYDDGSSAENRPPAAPPLLGSVERASAGFDLGYVDQPGQYTGHYVVYHRFAHDLHHRSTLVGYLSQLGVTLDGHRIRPL